MLTMQYQSEHAIGFDFLSGQLMVNATEMAKPFGKQPAHFLRLEFTGQYIEALKKRYAISHIVNVVHGDNGGTWLHQKLALRFAQWLSPEFAIWVDEKIEELLTRGRTEITTVSPLSLARQMLEAMEAQEQRMTAVETTVKRIEARVTTINDDYFSLSGWYKLNGRRWDMDLKSSQGIGRKLAKASQMNGFEVLPTHDAKYGKVNTYHKDVLKAVLNF